MEKIFNVAIIGLDTSHAVAFPGLMQDPETPEPLRIASLRAVSCLRFETPFQNKTGLDGRQKYLEGIGVPVTEDFDEATADCDAVMLEINDPSLHLEYFRKCAKLGKPVFLDKPFADTLENMLEIIRIARENRIRFFTSSSLRFDVDFREGLARGLQPDRAVVWGPVGRAASGSDIIWYGCHAFEMLQAAMGRGAVSVTGVQDSAGYVFHVSYRDGRRGTVELSPASGYGALIRDRKNDGVLVKVTGRIPFYRMLLEQILRFLEGEEPVALEDEVEVMAMLAAADRSLAEKGCGIPVFHL